MGVDIRRISDPTGVDAGAIFYPWVRLAPVPRIGGCERGFHFSPVGDLWISKILEFVGFGSASPRKFPSTSKFWQPNNTLTQISYRNPK
jgi:hypothetical protein